MDIEFDLTESKINSSLLTLCHLVKCIACCPDLCSLLCLNAIASGVYSI